MRLSAELPHRALQNRSLGNSHLSDKTLLTVIPELIRLFVKRQRDLLRQYQTKFT